MSDQQNIGIVHQCSNVIFHGLDTIIGLMVFIDAILLLSRTSSFVGFILPIYFAVFGILILLFVFYAPPQLYSSVFFYFNFCGRGLTFLFIGTVIITFADDFSLATGIITVVVAVNYLVFSIWTKFCHGTCSLPLPFMQRDEGIKDPRDNDDNTNKQQQPSSGDVPQTKQPNTPNDQQQYGSAYEDDKNYTPIEVNNSGVQIGNKANNEAKDINNEVLQSFGHDINSISKQEVPGYNSGIPRVLVMLEQSLHDSGGYKKRGIFDQETIASSKDNDESYLISNNIIAFFHELPSPLLSFVSPKVFESGVNKDAMWRVLEQMPTEQASVTQFVWDILAKVAKFEANTAQNSEQLARIFGPLMTMSKEQISGDPLRASRMIACWRRGIDWRMDKL